MIPHRLNFLPLLWLCASHIVPVSCFLPGASVSTSTSHGHSRTTISLNAVEKKSKRPKRGKQMTIAELVEKAQRNPSLVQQQQQQQDTKNKKRRRTRKRVDSPKQQYLYASQRQALERQGKLSSSENSSTETKNDFSPLVQAREMGLVNAAAQHADALVDTVEPEIMRQIRVGDDIGTSGSLAYIIYKPAGWSILGSGGKKKNAAVKETVIDDESSSNQRDKKQQKDGAKATKVKRMKIKEEDDSIDVLEYDENDVLALLSPEEKEEYELEMGLVSVDEQPNVNKKKDARIKRVKLQEEDGSIDILEYDESDILEVMTPEEIEEFNAQGGFGDGSTAVAPSSNTSRNVQKIQARSNDSNEKASFASPARPSVVAWLKDLKAAEGTPIRGGKYWTAIAGATNVDDTGLVVICPKDNVDNVFVDYAKYVAVVGNGKYLAPKSKTRDFSIPIEAIKMETISKLRKNRDDDIVLTVGLTVVEKQSTCTSLVQPCQTQFLDGIRGDPSANPLDRRASRRLLHCKGLSVSSLNHDDTAQVEVDELPDDIAILAERRNKHEFVDGSFLGRDELRDNPLTTCYREINGAADGFQGWTVDRYDKWLFVQHDDKCYKGPLPSIHDGNTAGVYYLPSNPNRSAMGSRKEARPILSEGQPAPDIVSVLENGITYHVSLDKDLSTGIFLDQRPQRAWLIRNCNKGTRVLNCFAHCGAFSVAAATAGASTVSLDLNKKWLDRIEPQLQANGIEFDDRHDCIYGDCFDWLARLSKRGETYDLVILDPPSSSVGKTKKRWSVKNDMASLVELAAPLVKKGGLLWTTTNSAGIHPIKFARMCQKGLENAGIKSAKLERVAPMPVDFPSIGPQPVKNLVWRI